MSCTLCFVHGLNSSHYSFAYMAKEIGAVSKIDYTSHQALDLSVAQVMKQLPKKDPIILIGHSLGGVISTLIALNQTHNVQKVVTISSPLGGSQAAAWMRWFVTLPVLSDITPSSFAMRRLVTETAPCPVLSIVSTSGGLPMISREPNDSVVTVSSQKALKYAKKIEVKANHFEVLMHEKTIEAVRKFVQPES